MGEYRRWSVVMASFFVMSHTPAMHYVFGIFFVEFLEAFGGSRGATAAIGSLSTGLMQLGAGFAGKVQAERGTQATVIAGGAIAAAGLGLCAASTELWMLFFAFGGVVGAGHALAFPPCPVAVAGWFQGRSDRTLASGLATAGSGAGTIALGAIASEVNAAAGWRVTFGLLRWDETPV